MPASSRSIALCSGQNEHARKGNVTAATGKCISTNANTHAYLKPVTAGTVSAEYSYSSFAKSGAAPKPSAINRRSPGSDALTGIAANTKPRPQKRACASRRSSGHAKRANTATLTTDHNQSHPRSCTSPQNAVSASGTNNSADNNTGRL